MSAPGCGQDVLDVLEAVCRHGCRHVRQVIAALERNDTPQDLLELDPDRRRCILTELQAIMAVYDRECGLDPGRASECAAPDPIRK
jgi:hypothetical protein